ncbi:MAG: hypothetical protein EOO90_21710 [Pedobacter sp.]|nr:MAG: hypothetical protein EOO90_21710 [Pedobacter sp.]
MPKRLPSPLLTFNNISLFEDDLFTSQCDAIVIPKSTTGTVSPSFVEGLSKAYHYEMQAKLVYQHLGEMQTISWSFPDSKGVKRTMHILFVTAVDNNTSDARFISQILEQVIQFAQENKNIQTISMPLIGTGAGNLSPAVVFNLIKSKFEFIPGSELKVEVYVTPQAHASIIKEMNPSIEYSKRKDELDAEDASLIREFIAARTCWLFDSRLITAGSIDLSALEDRDFFYDEVNLLGMELGSLVFLHSQEGFKPRSIIIQGMGISQGFDQTKNTIQIKWFFFERNYQVTLGGEEMGNFITRLDVKIATEILFQLPNWAKLLNEAAEVIIGDAQIFTSAESKIATLQNDSAVGIDHLGLTKDIKVFSRIIASSSFTPPLSIALFGKWGSGKSFFMGKLDSEIKRLSQQGSPSYRKGIAQIHFNAWSYTDANLWASMVSRIFEGLYQYINANSATLLAKDEIKKKLNSELVITSEHLKEVNQQRDEVQNQLNTLEVSKLGIAEQLEMQIKAIKSNTIATALKKVDDEFRVSEELTPIITNDPIVAGSVEELKKFIPARYWDSPNALYKEAKSSYTFLRLFFNGKNVIRNIIFVALIILAIYCMPIIVEKLKVVVGNYILPPLQFMLYSATLMIPLYKRAKVVYDKLMPTISAFWKIRQDYQSKIETAKNNALQLERSLEIEINIRQRQLSDIEVHIQTKSEQLSVLKLKSEHAIATEALYSFIEKRCSSEEYQKHLGLVSIIRRDFEVLSGLFTDHQQELMASGEIQKFRELFQNPLERIVLYIDDLDRCPQNRVVEVLEAVNLLMAFPLFVVIVGIDPRWVKKALENGRKLDEEMASSSDYLEKIFQVPFHLKGADDPQVKQMLSSLIGNVLGSSLERPQYSPVEETIPIPKPLAEYLENEIPHEERLAGYDDQPEVSEAEMKEHLELTAIETELILTMSKIIGNNPRAIKRYVNIYHIVRAHEGLTYARNNQAEEFRVVMFLLALYIGPYHRLLPALFDYFRIATKGQQSLGAFLKKPLNGKIELSRQSLLSILSDQQIYGELIDQHSSVFIRHNDFISRFSFENEL